MGWGPLAWERRPRPEAQTPWHAQRSCQDAGDSRPPVGPARRLQLQGICCSYADAIRRFPVSVLAPRLRPRVQPGGRGSGAWPPSRCQAGSTAGALPHPRAQTAACRLEAPRSEWGSLSSTACWPPTQNAGPLLSLLHSPHSPPTASSAGPGPGLASQLSHPFLPCPGAGSRRGFRPSSCLDSAPCRQLMGCPPPLGGANRSAESWEGLGLG